MLLHFVMCEPQNNPRITALAAERDEHDVHVLSEVIEIGMRLMRAQEAYSTARLAALAAEGAALNPGEDPTAAYSKIALTVRRTVALKKQLGQEVKTRRSGLLGERAALGLVPDICVKRGDTWWVRRSDTSYEIIQEEKRGSLPPLYGEGRRKGKRGACTDVPRAATSRARVTLISSLST